MMKSSAITRPSRQEGYAILFVLFLVALVIVGGSAVMMNQLTEGRRDKEAETIWRGKQYERAIGMYYRKFGRFPTSVDDLVKVQNGELRFLREAYKNPMNKEDGTWRFIYVTPAGQLIGSVQYVSLQQMALLDQQRRMGMVTGPAVGVAGGSDASDSTNNTGSNASAQPAQLGQTGAVGSAGSLNRVLPNLPALGAQQQQLPGPGQNLQQPGASPFFTQPAQGQPGASSGLSVQESSGSDSTDSNGQIVGGFIIGVAGKKDKLSVKIYKGGITYKRWEFIFNPLEQVQTLGTISTTTGPTSPTGTQTQPNGTQPPSTVPQMPQIPQQSQTPQQQH